MNVALRTMKRCSTVTLDNNRSRSDDDRQTVLCCPGRPYRNTSTGNKISDRCFASGSPNDARGRRYVNLGGFAAWLEPVAACGILNHIAPRALETDRADVMGLRIWDRLTSDREYDAQ